MKRINQLIILTFLLILSTGCNTLFSNKEYPTELRVDGSSTVAPITEAVIEDFASENKNVNIVMGISGTGGGFKKFVTGETAVSNASRAIKDTEIENAKKNDINYTELQIAKDALTIVVSKENDWIKDITIEQLQQIWAEGNENIKWSDLDPSWPKEKIKLYGPGLDSGTYDYFKEEVMHDKKMRADYTASTDENVLVIGVAGDKYALSFVGYVYYLGSAKKLTPLSVNGVAPSVDNIQSGIYTPLARPLFIYVNKDMYKKDNLVKDFVDYYIKVSHDIANEVGYVGLDEKEIKANQKLLEE